MTNDKDKILFWIEDFLPHFGIAKYIQEKYPCKIFGIITSNSNSNSKKFFLKQNFVSFEKLWFYRDKISSGKQNVDENYLKTFEKKYDIPLWKIIYGERLFSEMNRYHNFTEKEILSLVEQQCKFYEEILNEINPDFLICRVPDFQHIHLLYELCKAKKIPVLLLNWSRLGHRATIVDIDEKPIELDVNEKVIKLRNFEELREHVRGYSSQQKIMLTKRRVSNSQRLSAFFQLLKTNSNDFQDYYYNVGKSPINVLMKESKLLLKKRFRKNFINKNFKTKISKKNPFVYFPMHLEPERMLLIKTPYYTNQLELIKNIAKSLPIDFRLFVKEHPAQQLSGWRKISYYKEIMNLSNVELFHPSTPNEELIKNSSLIITIAGTSGFEAALYQKPSIIFSDVAYSNLSCVSRLKSLEDLPLVISSSLETKVDLHEINLLIKKLELSSFSFDMTEFYQDNDNFFNFGGFLNSSHISIPQMERYFQLYEEKFISLANEHIKIITNYNSQH